MLRISGRETQKALTVLTKRRLLARSHCVEGDILIALDPRRQLSFIAYAIVEWLAEKKIRTIYITPDSPWEDDPH
ncbi:MAG TPA: hypothetical protein VIS99_14740 [Terrimicrobiaceae bacterium]